MAHTQHIYSHCWHTTQPQLHGRLSTPQAGLPYLRSSNRFAGGIAAPRLLRQAACSGLHLHTDAQVPQQQQQHVCSRAGSHVSGLLQSRQHCKQRQPWLAVAASKGGQQQPEQQLPQQQSLQQQQTQQPPPHQQQQQEDADPQSAASSSLNLPASRSAAQWLNNLNSIQLQQLAHDWGYQQLGRPLPEGLSVTAIAETMPDKNFVLDLGKAIGYLALSLGLMAAGYTYLWYWHTICPLWQQLLCWLVIGTGYFGAFQTAVDCSHFAFWPQRPLMQDLLGATLMAPALMSYEVWRLKYFNHLMCTNQLYEDTDAWHPLLPADLADLPTWQRALLQLLMATPLKFFASIGQWFRSLEGFDLKLHPAETRPWVWLSWALPLGFIGVVWPAMIAAGGVGAWVSWWLGPWAVFHCWLSVLSLVRHTAPHIPWEEEGLTYDHAQATINGTVSVKLPNWIEVLIHHANCHLPKHVAISIPSYNLKDAQAYLEQRLGKYLTIAELNPQLLRNLMTAWLVYDPQQQQYVDFDQAEELIQDYKQQRQQQQQQEMQQLQWQQQQKWPQSESNSSSAAGSNGTHGSHVSSSSSTLERQQWQGEQQPSSSSAAAFGV